MSERNTVVLVDKQDKALGVEDKLIAHQKGLLHRAFSVMLYRYDNNQLQFLLQKRAADKYHCAGLWTNTCCSHPDVTQDITQSAAQRLKEELLDIDISNLKLTNIGNFTYRAEFDNGLIEHEYDHVFIAEYDNTPDYFNKSEIAELVWVDANQIKTDLKLNKTLYTPWFAKVLEFCLNSLDKNKGL